MDAWLAYLLVSLVALAILGVGGYFVLRKLFMRAADRMAHHIERVLSQLATVGLSGRTGQMSPAAARAAVGRLTHLGAYAAAEGLSEEAASAQFTRSIERVARLMDSAVKIPVIGRVGLDALLGLVPVAGDAASAAVSISLIARSVRYGIPREIITKMLANVLVDLLLGAVPLVGDLADIWFKANERNVRLLKEYLGDEARDTIDAAVVSRV
jgi:Domain of unknown function (DUF4112)